jgi:hypothetical protein
MQWIQFMSVICKDGQLEISAKDSVFYQKEQNSVFGQELNFMMNFYQNMAGNFITMLFKENLRWDKDLDMLIMDLI